MTAIVYEDLEQAFDFASSGEIVQSSAYISRDSGRVYWVSDDLVGMELPDNIDDSEHYAEVPTKRDLGLGKRLALRFASKELPEKYDVVDGFFRKRGAYGRFKDLLEEKGALEKWYRFEEESIREALCAWAEDEGFTVIDERAKDAT